MSARKRIVVFGAAGQARDTAWLIRELVRAGNGFELVGFVVSDRSKLGPYDSAIVGDMDWLLANRGNVDAIAMGIGSPAVRLRIAEQLERELPRVEWPVLVHPSVVIDRESARLEPGAMIAAGTAGSVNIAIERHGLVNIGCTLGHEATIGAGCVVNHGASISGGVVLERAVLVGTGARVLQYLRVREGATVGAGAVVTRDVDPGVTVVGIPARPIESRAS
ncbi:MAG: acetyltransferase [Myxococcota bacterium]|nr:acetyltransferase [Myxococcota bacterium]